MPFTFHISEADQIIYVTGSGEITLQDCLDAVAERSKYTESGKILNTFLDMSQVTNTPPLAQMRRIAASILEY